MKKLLFTIFLFFTFVLTSYGQYEWRQYFDGADTIFGGTSFQQSIYVKIENDSSNIWQIGKPQKVIFNSAATIPNAITTDTLKYYPTNNTSRFLIKVKPWQNRGIFALQWKQKLDMDADHDGGLIEYSIDHGNKWVSVFNNPFVYNFYGFKPQNKDTLDNAEVGFSGQDTTWRDIWLCFSMSWMQQAQDTIYFRYTFKSDSIDNKKEGWLIDNMMARITIIHTVTEIKQEKYLNVFPNPANDLIYIEAQKLQGYHIIEQMILVNTIGQVVDEWKNIPTKFYFDAKKYKSGSYYLHIKTNIKSETIPILIQNN